MSSDSIDPSQRGISTVVLDKSSNKNADIQTDVLIVGAGPAGSSLACFLGYHGIKGLVISRNSTTSPQPRAHVTNGAAFECLRDIGLEDEYRLVGFDNSYYGEYRFSNTLKGEDFIRNHSIGNHPSRLGDYSEATPCPHADVGQNLGEPILLKYATQHGFQSRFDYKFLDFVEDSTTGLITSTIEDQVTLQKVRIISKYLCGADGTNSYVARQLKLPFHDLSSGALALNIWYEADLSEIYRFNPGLLHAVSTPHLDSPAWGIIGINRIVRPYTEFLMGMLARPGAESNNVPEAEVVARLRQLIGDENVKIKVKGMYKWRINESYAEVISKGNVFCLGDAIHKHPPGNGLGSNTCIQDAYNLAWKLAYVLKGKAGPSLLATYHSERQPVAKRIVKIANDAIRYHVALHSVVGTYIPDKEQRVETLALLREDSPRGKQQRAALRKAAEDLRDESEGLGAEMNQQYSSTAICVEDEVDPCPTWQDGRGGVRYHIISTYPGSRLPHAWLGTDKVGERVSTHDLAGHGEFTLFTGTGGKQTWSRAAEEVTAATGVKVNVYSIGPGEDFSDMFYLWEERRSVDENGAVLVRPDRTVAWRSRDLGLSGRLLPVVRSILGLL